MPVITFSSLRGPKAREWFVKAIGETIGAVVVAIRARRWLRLESGTGAPRCEGKVLRV